MNQTRRTFLASMMVLPGGVTRLWRLGMRQEGVNPPVTSPNSPFNKAFDFSSLASWITPNADFFIRSHFGMLAPGRAWTLKVHGSVERELALTLDELRGMTMREIPATLECAGNLVG